MVSLLLFECQRAAPPAAPPTKEAQLVSELANVRANRMSAQRLETLPVTIEHFEPSRANLIVWLDHSTTIFDDSAMLDEIAPLALLDRLDAGRGLGPRESTDLKAELLALEDDADRSRGAWGDAGRHHVWPHAALAPSAQTSVRDVMLTARPFEDAHLDHDLEVLVRSAEGLRHLPLQLGRWQYESCTHELGSTPLCSLPGIRVSSQGWCAWAGAGWVGNECFPLSEIASPEDLEQGRTRRDILNRDCAWVSLSRMLETVDRIVAAHPGCVRSKVTAIGDLTWSEITPGLAALAARGLRPGLGWIPPSEDPAEDGYDAAHRWWRATYQSRNPP